MKQLISTLILPLHIQLSNINFNIDIKYYYCIVIMANNFDTAKICRERMNISNPTFYKYVKDGENRFHHIANWTEKV